MLVFSRSQFSVSKMAVAQQSVNFALLSQDNINSTDAVLSITAVNTGKIPFWRAVLSVKEEQDRYFGSRHRSAVESAPKLSTSFQTAFQQPRKNGC